MNLKESIPFNHRPLLPESVSKRFLLSTTCEISQHEGELFYVAFHFVGKEAEEDNLPKTGTVGNVIISDKEDVSLLFDDSFSAGACIHVLYYPIYKWRAMKFGDYQMLTCILEEICHFLWNISDEIEVKRKVVKIAKRYNPKISLATLYPGI